MLLQWKKGRGSVCGKAEGVGHAQGSVSYAGGSVCETLGNNF